MILCSSIRLRPISDASFQEEQQSSRGNAEQARVSVTKTYGGWSGLTPLDSIKMPADVIYCNECRRAGTLSYPLGWREIHSGLLSVFSRRAGDQYYRNRITLMGYTRRIQVSQEDGPVSCGVMLLLVKMIIRVLVIVLQMNLHSLWAPTCVCVCVCVCVAVGVGGCVFVWVCVRGWVCVPKLLPIYRSC